MNDKEQNKNPPGPKVRKREIRFPSLPNLDRELIEAISKHQCLLKVASSGSKAKVIKAWEDVLEQLKRRFPAIKNSNVNTVDLKYNFKLLLKRVSKKLEKFVSAAEKKALTPSLVPNDVENKVIECFPRLLIHKNHLMEGVVRNNLELMECDSPIDLTDNAMDGISNMSSSFVTRESIEYLHQDYLLEDEITRTNEDAEDVFIDSTRQEENVDSFDSNLVDNLSNNSFDSNLLDCDRSFESAETLYARYGDLISESSYNESSYEIIDFDNRNCFQISEEDIDRIETSEVLIGSRNADMLMLAKVLSRQTYSDVVSFSEILTNDTSHTIESMNMFWKMIISELTDYGLRVSDKILRERWKSTLRFIRNGATNLECFLRKKDIIYFNFFWFTLLTFPHLFCLYEIEQDDDAACNKSDTSKDGFNLLKSTEYFNWMANYHEYYKHAQSFPLLFAQQHNRLLKEACGLYDKDTISNNKEHVRHSKPIKLPNKDEIIEMNRRLQTASVPPTIKSKKSKLNWRPANTRVQAPWMTRPIVPLPVSKPENVKVYYDHNKVKQVESGVAYKNYLELMKNVESLSKTNDQSRSDIQEPEKQIRPKRVYRKRKIKKIEIVDESSCDDEGVSRTCDDSQDGFAEESQTNEDEESDEICCDDNNSAFTNSTSEQISSNVNETSAKDLLNPVESSLEEDKISTIESSSIVKETSPKANTSIMNSEISPKENTPVDSNVDVNLLSQISIMSIPISEPVSSINETEASTACDGSEANQSGTMANCSISEISSSSLATENDSVVNLTQSALSEQQYQDLWEILKMNNIDPQTVTILDPTASQDNPPLTIPNDSLQTLFVPQINSSSDSSTLSTDLNTLSSEIPLTLVSDCSVIAQSVSPGESVTLKDVNASKESQSVQPFDTTVLEESAKECNIDLRSYYSLMANSIGTSESSDSLNTEAADNSLKAKPSCENDGKVKENSPQSQKKIIVIKTSSLSPVKQGKKIKLLIKSKNNSTMKSPDKFVDKVLPKLIPIKYNTSLQNKMCIAQKKTNFFKRNVFKQKYILVKDSQIKPQTRTYSKVQNSSLDLNSKIIDLDKSTMPLDKKTVTMLMNCVRLDRRINKTPSVKLKQFIQSIKEPATTSQSSTDDVEAVKDSEEVPTETIVTKDDQVSGRSSKRKQSIEVLSSDDYNSSDEEFLVPKKIIRVADGRGDSEDHNSTHDLKQKEETKLRYNEVAIRNRTVTDLQKDDSPIEISTDDEESIETQLKKERTILFRKLVEFKLKEKKLKEQKKRKMMEPIYLDEDFEERYCTKLTEQQPEFVKDTSPEPETPFETEKTMPSKSKVVKKVRTRPAVEEGSTSKLKVHSENKIDTITEIGKEASPELDLQLEAENKNDSKIETNKVHPKNKKKVKPKLKNQVAIEKDVFQEPEMPLKSKVEKKLMKTLDAEKDSTLKDSTLKDKTCLGDKKKVTPKPRKQLEVEKEKSSELEIQAENEMASEIEVRIAKKMKKKSENEMASEIEIRIAKKLKKKSEIEIEKSPELDMPAENKISQKLEIKPKPEVKKDTPLDESGEDDDIRLSELLKSNEIIIQKTKFTSDKVNKKEKSLKKSNLKKDFKDDIDCQTNTSDAQENATNAKDGDICYESPSIESPQKVKKRVSFKLQGDDDEDSDYADRQPLRKKKKIAQQATEPQKKTLIKQKTKNVSTKKTNKISVSKDKTIKKIDDTAPKSPYDFEESDSEEEKLIKASKKNWKRIVLKSSDSSDSSKSPIKNYNKTNPSEIKKCFDKNKLDDLRSSEKLTLSKLSKNKKVLPVSNELKNVRNSPRNDHQKKDKRIGVGSLYSNKINADSSDDDAPLSAVTKQR